MAVRTDIHSHFAGVLPPDELIAIGLEHDIHLDAATAKRTKVVDPEYNGPSLPLRSLSKDQIEQLKKEMQLDPRRQSLFDYLDQIYANRGFIAKNNALFVPLLERIAKSYQQQGVVYAELSYAGIIGNPQLLKELHENLPRIEAETGVKIRFLGALWRHSDPEWNEDEADKLKGLLKSPYVVGIDVMGHETNPTREMKKVLEGIVGDAALNVPGFNVRIHAGENPYILRRSCRA